MLGQKNGSVFTRFLFLGFLLDLTGLIFTGWKTCSSGFNVPKMATNLLKPMVMETSWGEIIVFNNSKDGGAYRELKVYS